MKSTIMRSIKSVFGGGIGGHVRTLYFKRFIKQSARQKDFKVILDAGCGAGSYSFFIAGQFPSSFVYAYDLAGSVSFRNNIKECLSIQKDNGITNISFQEKDLLSLNEDNKYDLAYSIDVLEHIPGNRKVIENIFNALKAGGVFYLAMPWDEANERLLPAFFFKNFDSWADEEHIGEQYSLPELCSLMKQVGFTILEARYTFGIYGKMAWEIEKALEHLKYLRTLVKPLLKGLGRLDLDRHNNHGDLLVIALKP